MTSADIPTNNRCAVVIGGGVIGLSIARELLTRGWRVQVVERNSIGAGAAAAAGGMLAPNREAGETGGAMLALGRESLRLWPDFAARLHHESGTDPGLRGEGSLEVAFDEQHALHLSALARDPDARAEHLSAAETLRREPGLARDIAAAVFVPDDIQVDAPAVLSALARSFRARGGEVFENAQARRIEPGARPRVLVGSGGGGGWFDADMIIVAAGWEAGSIAGVRVLEVLHPVKGHIIRYRAAAATPVSRVIAAPGVYIVPKADGAILAGATSEPGACDAAVDDRLAVDLAKAAARVVPALAGRSVDGALTGVRPATPDGAPIIGWAAEGVFVAAGHYRNGVLLAPATAVITADLAEGAGNVFAGAFDPSRFARRSLTSA